MAISYFLLFIAGLVGGFIAGLIGIGGGIIYVLVIPEALRLMGVPPIEVAQYTIANSLFVIFIASAMVNFRHFKVKIYVYEILTIGIASSIASLLSLKWFVNTHHYSLLTYNIVTLFFIVFLFCNTLIKRKAIKITLPVAHLTLIFLLIGALGGIISSFSGLGGGIVVIPLLCSFMNMDIKKASIISSGVIMVTSLVSTVYNLLEIPKHQADIYQLGYIIFPIAIALILGVIITSGLGVRYAKKLSSQNITYIYSILLFLIILKKAFELITMI